MHMANPSVYTYVYLNFSEYFVWSWMHHSAYVLHVAATLRQADTQNSTNSRKVYLLKMNINILSYYLPHFVNNVSCAAIMECRALCRPCMHN